MPFGPSVRIIIVEDAGAAGEDLIAALRGLPYVTVAALPGTGPAADGAAADTNAIVAGELSRQLRALVDQVRRGSNYARRFAVSAGGEYSFIDTTEISWIESADNYVALHAGKKRYLVRRTLAAIEEVLDPDEFLRVRHSAIVNLRRVRSILRWSPREFEFVLESGERILSSKKYLPRVRRLLNG